MISLFKGRHEHHPGVLLRVHPARADQPAAAAQEPMRAAGHLGDPGIQHHGVPLHVRALQREPGTFKVSIHTEMG